MKKTLLVALLTFGITLTGCNRQPVDTEYDPSDTDIQVELSASLSTQETAYNLIFKYNDKLFLNDAKTYNKKLAKLSFGCATSTSTKEVTAKFFTDCEFEDITPVGFDETPTADSCAYTFAHKTIDDYELIAVSFRGFNYQKEWANNFVVGKTGDHEGFSLRANETYSALQTYIASHSGERKLKLWINGYSRGGAIANVLSSLILRGDEIAVLDSNMFTYTYEAPNALIEEHAIAYENVHNIVNSGDLITNFAPTQYGLSRCGIDHEIYDSNVASIMKQFDQGIVLPDYVEVDGLNEEGESAVMTNDVEFVRYLFRYCFNINSSDETLIANTREQYVDNYQDAITYCIGMIFSLSNSTRKELMDDISSKDTSEIYSIIATGESLTDYIKPFLDKDHIEYVETELQSNLETLMNMAMNVFFSVVIFALGNTKADLERLIDVHYPEAVYALLLNSFN